MNYLDYFTKDEAKELFKQFCEKMNVPIEAFKEQFNAEQSPEKQAIAAKLIIKNEVEPEVFQDFDFAKDLEEQVNNYLGTGKLNPSEQEIPIEKVKITDSDEMEPEQPFA